MNAEHGRGEREQRQRECERHAWDYESRTFWFMMQLFLEIRHNEHEVYSSRTEVTDNERDTVLTLFDLHNDLSVSS